MCSILKLLPLRILHNKNKKTATFYFNATECCQGRKCMWHQGPCKQWHIEQRVALNTPAVCKLNINYRALQACFPVKHSCVFADRVMDGTLGTVWTMQLFVCSQLLYTIQLKLCQHCLKYYLETKKKRKVFSIISVKIKYVIGE